MGPQGAPLGMTSSFFFGEGGFECWVREKADPSLRLPHPAFRRDGAPGRSARDDKFGFFWEREGLSAGWE